MSAEWKPISSAPFQKIILVRNPEMQKPVRATRGYQTEMGVHPDTTFFTSVFTNDPYFPFPAGKLVCPTEWMEEDEQFPVATTPVFSVGR